MSRSSCCPTSSSLAGIGASSRRLASGSALCSTPAIVARSGASIVIVGGASISGIVIVASGVIGFRLLKVLHGTVDMPLVTWDCIPLVTFRGVMASFAAAVVNDVAVVLGKASSGRSIIGVVVGAFGLGLFPFSTLVLTVLIV